MKETQVYVDIQNGKRRVDGSAFGDLTVCVVLVLDGSTRFIQKEFKTVTASFHRSRRANYNKRRASREFVLRNIRRA